MDETPTHELPTAEHIASLFPEYGLIPHPAFYLHVVPYQAPCGCVVGVLLVDAAGGIGGAQAARVKAGHNTQRAVAELAGLPPAYIRGLDIGFSFPEAMPAGVVSEQLAAGYETGCTVRRLVLPAADDAPAVR